MSSKRRIRAEILAPKGDTKMTGNGLPKSVLICGLLVAGAALSMALLYVALEFDWVAHLSAKSIKTWIKDLGYWGVIVSIVLMVAHSVLPFPAEIIAIANGMVYGPVWGTVITWSGAMLGAIVAFGVTRKFGRPFLVKVMRDDQLRRLDSLSESHGPMMIFLARFVPLIAFNLVNIAAGLTRVPWWAFVASTGIGILPFTVIMVWLGHGIDAMRWESWLALFGSGLILWLLLRHVLDPRRRASRMAAVPIGHGVAATAVPKELIDRKARYLPAAGVGLLAAIVAFSSVAFGSVVLAHTEIKGSAIVLSGDSMEVDGVKVRLKGVMAPTDGQTCEAYGRTYDCRRISATALMDLTAGLIVNCRVDQVDRNVPTMAACSAGGYDLSEGMVYTGWALAYPRLSNRYLPLEDRARLSRHGLWRGTFVPPWDWPTKGRAE